MLPTDSLKHAPMDGILTMNIEPWMPHSTPMIYAELASSTTITVSHQKESTSVNFKEDGAVVSTPYIAHNNLFKQHKTCIVETYIPTAIDTLIHYSKVGKNVYLWRTIAWSPYQVKTCVLWTKFSIFLGILRSIWILQIIDIFSSVKKPKHIIFQPRIHCTWCCCSEKSTELKEII